MPATKTVHLAVPRRMLVTLRRCRGIETVAVLDRLPVALPDLSEADAPVALRRETRAAEPADVRIHDGRFYMAVDMRADVRGVTPDGHAEALVAYLRDRLDRGQDQPPANRWDLVDPREFLRDASRKRGVGEVSGLDIQECHDDGRAAQADLLARAARDWVLVNGRLHQRVGAPQYLLGGFETGGVYAHAAAPLAYEPVERFPRVTYESFRPDRPEDAAALTMAWEAETGSKGIPTVDGWEIVRPDLVEAAYGPDDPAAMAAWQARTIVAAAAPCIGYADDAALQRYALLRRAGEEPGTVVDPEAVMEGLRGLVATLAEVGARSTYRAKDSFARLAQVARLALLRHDAVERPRADAAEMGGLAR